jgi:RNA polymerase sigma-70 factor, ECF subfamily
MRARGGSAGHLSLAPAAADAAQGGVLSRAHAVKHARSLHPSPAWFVARPHPGPVTGRTADPDRDLVRRAQRGDRYAFERLADRHQNRMYTLAARVLGSRDEAADAVQEAFLRAWRRLDGFRGDALFSTWLYRICVNAAHDQRERRGPAELVEPEETAAERRDRFAEHELAGELQQALADLDEPFRVVAVLYDVLGCSYAEIAEITGTAEGTVKSRLFRARTELARRLGTERGRAESNT